MRIVGTGVPCGAARPSPGVRARVGGGRRALRPGGVPRAGGTRALAREASGQMAVELALLVPVIVVVALVAVNLMRFAELCARFDRVSLDAVLAQGVSPEGGSEGMRGAEAVREALEAAMGDGSCEIEVSVADASGSGGGATFDLGAGTVRYVCVMRMRPWPSRAEVAGVGYQMPAMLRHEREFVVDRYRAGVVT